METVLITGASSGIGKEIAHIYASRGNKLVLVARSTQKLTKLKRELEEKYGIEAIVKSFDLSHSENAKQLYKETSSEGIDVDYLINNAGVGRMSEFINDELIENEKMMNLNMNSLVILSHLYLQDMKKRNSGGILNVASTAAFQPGPNMAVYYASKAFVLNFSEAIHEELQGSKIKVACLCPGPSKTDFFSGHGLSNLKALDKVPWTQSAEDVALVGVRALEGNRAVKISGLINFLVALSVRFTPRILIRKITQKINS